MEPIPPSSWLEPTQETPRNIAVERENERDGQGRYPVTTMTNRELLEECVTTMRATQDMVEAFIKDFSNNPMLGMFGKMLGKKN